MIGWTEDARDEPLDARAAYEAAKEEYQAADAALVEARTPYREALARFLAAADQCKAAAIALATELEAEGD